MPQAPRSRPPASIPPRWATWLLQTFGRPDTVEEVQGDLLELYPIWVDTLGKRRANWRYSLNALKLLRPLAKRKQKEQYTTPYSLSPVMLRNYAKIALRNLAKQKRLTLINILSLSIGLACFSLFLLYAINELTFDRFHAKADSIYRIYRWTEAMEGQAPEGDPYLPMPLGPAMKQDLPDVVNYVRWSNNSDQFVRANNSTTRMDITFADPQVFDVFTFPLVSGDPRVALRDLHSVVLTEKAAHQLFGTENPIGKTIELKVEKQFEPFTVTAIAQNPLQNSGLPFNILLSFNYLESTARGQRHKNNWRSSSYQTYVLLHSNSKLPTDTDRLHRFRQKYYPNEEQELRKAGYWTKTGIPVSYRLQSIKSIHTDTRVSGSDVPAIDPKIIWILLGIASGVLLIACINFTTLAIGRSVGRAKEVGVRKVVGGNRRQLIGQFLAESALLTGLSAILGALICQQLLPIFNKLSGRELSFSISAYPELLWLLAGLLVLVSLIAGSYPALVLSGFQPIDVLKSKLKIGGANLFTKSLVTFQFVLSAGLIASTFIIMQQLQFMRTHNPGFDKENIIVLDASGVNHTRQAYNLIKHKLLQNRSVIGVASSEQGLGGDMGWSRQGFDYKGQYKEVYEYFIDSDYINVLGMKLISGRHFSPRIAADTMTSVIINEAMMRDFGWTPETAIGQQIKGYAENLTPTVIGVVKDFHFRSFAEIIQPQLFHQFNDYAPFKFFVRVQPGDPTTVLADIQNAWTSTIPDFPLKYSFLDDDLNRFYKSEARWSQIVGWAGGISIFLACLGLFGLATLAAGNRVKEIGIRKVLGASILNISALLAKDFVKLVLIAFAIATPIAWYFMNKWLQGFAFRISVEWWVFVLTGAVSLLIALLTVSLQSIKAALMNPVNSLKME